MTDEARAARAAYKREWTKKHRAELNAYNKKWRAANKDKVRQYNRQYWERRAKKAAAEQDQGATE